MIPYKIKTQIFIQYYSMISICQDDGFGNWKIRPFKSHEHVAQMLAENIFEFQSEEEIDLE